MSSRGLGEGKTPLVVLPRIAARLEVATVSAKLEGCNPTGSFEDRVAAASMAAAARRGAAGWIATSSGNAATALAAYGARHGIPGLLFVQPNIPREKLLPALACGVTVHRVRGVGTGSTPAAGRGLIVEVLGAAERHDLFVGVTAYAFNPEGMRGAEPLGGEIAAQHPRAEAVYVPTGGGGLATAIGNGLRAAEHRAAVVVVQPEGCAPIVRHLDRELKAPVVDGCTSAISGLQVPAPPDGEAATAVVRGSGGWGTAVSDEAIWAAQFELAAEEGIFVEPAAAAALAGAQADRRLGRLGPGSRICLVLTATGLKDLTAVERGLASPEPVELHEVGGLADGWVASIERVRA
ncbi:MAG TPA: pyridoxal-phosphate dependent enzyme [Solirubrobacterales bacterium]